ncbi:MAG: DnaJ domain-containing protein [Clostridia bacterium]|nr:DnaJ domain-containing protein [Clostridia bacterium]
MQNPFLTLGIPATSDTRAVRDAYHKLVKLCHPDIVQGEAQKQQAQERMIALNLAYEEALRFACRPQVRISPVTLDDSLRLANRLLARRMAASAQRALERCPQRDATWYSLHGRALHEQGQYDRAHQSYRQAVRFDPENTNFRMGALKAYVAARESQKIGHRVVDWARNIGRSRG